MRSIKKLTTITAMVLTLGVGFAGAAFADSHGGKPVGITPDLMSITVKHNGKDVEIIRHHSIFRWLWSIHVTLITTPLWVRQ